MEGVLLGAPSSIADAPNNFPLFQYCPPVKFDGRTSSVTFNGRSSSVRFFLHFYGRCSSVQTLWKKLFRTNKQLLRKIFFRNLLRKNLLCKSEPETLRLLAQRSNQPS